MSMIDKLNYLVDVKLLSEEQSNKKAFATIKSEGKFSTFSYA